jgi:phenylacetate-CoA ligase
VYHPLETASRTEIEQHQLERLNQLLGAIRADNPFYASRNLPAQLVTLADLSSLPFTTKGELVADQEKHPPFGSNLTYPLESYTHLHRTSGTIGRSLHVLDTPESWAWWAECWSYVYAGAGVGRGDRVYLAFSFGPFIGFWTAYHGAERVGAMAISGGGQSTEVRLKSLIEEGATVLVCTPTYALHLAEVARQHGLDLAEESVRVTIHAGEPGASVPATRNHIERVWGARCFDHAGASEVGAYSYSCALRTGLHLNEAEFIFEVIDPASGQPVPSGGQGELVVTNLGRWGSPVIRYRTGDIVQTTQEPCECGRTFRFVPGGLTGRTDDMVVIRGVNVYPSALESIVRTITEGEFRITYYRQGELDALGLEVETSATAAAEIRAAIQRALALDAEVQVVEPGTLPRFELKARRVRDLRDSSRSPPYRS